MVAIRIAASRAALVLLLVAATPPGTGVTAAGKPWIEAAVDSAKITVGSPAHITVRVHAPDGFEVGAASLEGEPKDVVVRDVTAGPQSVGSEGEKVAETIITVTAYATGTFMLPPAHAIATRDGSSPDTLTTDSLRLVVASVLAAGPDSAKLRDIKDVVRLPGRTFPLRAILIGLVVLAALVAAAIWLRRRLRRRGRRAAPAQPAAPPTPPEIAARRALAELRGRGLHLRGLMDEFYTELTAIVRTYLGARFRFAAIDMTTTEIMTELDARRARGAITREVTSLSRQLLDDGDLVKFAKGRPAVEAAEAAFDAAEHLIVLTQPVAPMAAATGTPAVGTPGAPPSVPGTPPSPATGGGTLVPSGASRGAPEGTPAAPGDHGEGR